MRSIHQPSLRDLSHAHVVPGVETPYLFSVTARGTPRHAAAPERGSMSRSNVRKPRAPDNSEASGAATLLRVTDPRSGAVVLNTYETPGYSRSVPTDMGPALAGTP